MVGHDSFVRIYVGSKNCLQLVLEHSNRRINDSGESSTGLGLFIVKKIVLDMGGDVDCREAVGGGCIFRVRLPSGRSRAESDMRPKASLAEHTGIRYECVMKKQAWLCIIGMLLAVEAGAEMRTWTTRSGSAVEAEFLRREGPQVYLRTADGKELQIHGGKLAQVDIDYIKAGPPPASSFVPAKKATPPEPQAAAKPVAVKKPAAAKASGPFSYQKVTPPAFDSMKFPALRDATESYRLAIQFGESEVMYCVFDTESWKEAHDRLYIMIPGDPKYSTPQKLMGKVKTSGDIPQSTFPSIPLKSRIGDVALSGSISFSIGEHARGLLSVVAELTLQKGSARTKLHLAGSLNDVMEHGEGAFPVVQLCVAPKLNLRSDYTGKLNVLGTLAMGSLQLVDKAGSVGEVDIEVALKGGKKVEKFTWSLDEKKVFKMRHGNVYTMNSIPAELGRTYNIHAVSDLGPIIGVVEKTHSQKMKEKH